MFHTKFVEKIKTLILCSVTFSKIALFMRKCGKKYCRVGHATDGNMTLADCMLDI